MEKVQMIKSRRTKRIKIRHQRRKNFINRHNLNHKQMHNNKLSQKSKIMVSVKYFTGKNLKIICKRSQNHSNINEGEF